MSAAFKVSPQQESKERVCLKNVLPLETPLSLQIELASTCNFHCKFCIHGNPDLIQNQQYKIGVMDYDLFCKIVDDLKGFPQKIKFISLQCRGESLLNPYISEMIRYLKESDVTLEIVLNTNASLLTEELSLSLIEAGLDCLRVSVEATSSEGYQEIAGIPVDFDNLVEKISFFYMHRKNCFVYTKILDCGMSEQEKEKFKTIFMPISDRIFIENPINLWKDAGLDESQFRVNRWNLPVHKTEICPRIFFAYAIHFDGTIVSCDSDWKEETPLGNAWDDNVAEIWNGVSFQQMRVHHLKKQASMYSRCKDCFVYQECLTTDCLDGEESRLLKLYQKLAGEEEYIV